jgi:hypothetical protein
MMAEFNLEEHWGYLAEPKSSSLNIAAPGVSDEDLGPVTASIAILGGSTRCS